MTELEVRHAPPRPFATRVREATELATMRGALWLLTRLGPVHASNAAGALFRTIGPFLPVTRVAHANLRAAFPGRDATWRRHVVRGMWENLGRTAGEFPHVASLRQDTPSGPGWEIVNDQMLTALTTRGGPAIFVSGHIGNWEVLPAALASYGIALSSVYRAASNQAVDRLVVDLRRRAVRRPDLPMFAKGGAGAKAALAHLRRGGYLGMLIDQKMNDGVEARLFGLPAMTAPAAAALALRFGCPVIPGHVQRLGPARFRLVAEPPLTLPDSGDRQADLLAATQMINDCLERWVRARPESWLWLHRRFKDKAIYS